MNKMAYQKRALTISMLCEVFELYPRIPLGEILSTLISPIGEDKHPYLWSDNELMGKIEDVKALLEEDYQLEFIQEYES